MEKKCKRTGRLFRRIVDRRNERYIIVSVIVNWIVTYVEHDEIRMKRFVDRGTSRPLDIMRATIEESLSKLKFSSG